MYVMTWPHPSRRYRAQEAAWDQRHNEKLYVSDSEDEKDEDEDKVKYVSWQGILALCLATRMARRSLRHWRRYAQLVSYRKVLSKYSNIAGLAINLVQVFRA
jgi:hypothetical protein